MRLQNPFAAVSPSGLDSQVLAVLARTDQFLSVQQIHALLPESGSRAGVRISVGRFVDQGTVVERLSGRSLTYALNDEHLVAGAIRQIATSRRRLLDRMREAVAAWPVQPLSVVVFGSAVRDEMRSDSDIDVLVVMPDGVDDETVSAVVDEFSSRLTRWTGNDARLLVYWEDEIEPAAVLSSILDEGIHIAGDPAWLRRRIRRRSSV